MEMEWALRWEKGTVAANAVAAVADGGKDNVDTARKEAEAPDEAFAVRAMPKPWDSRSSGRKRG